MTRKQAHKILTTAARTPSTLGRLAQRTVADGYLDTDAPCGMCTRVLRDRLGLRRHTRYSLVVVARRLAAFQARGEGTP